MKKATSSRNRRIKTSTNPRFNADSVKIMRTVQDPEAFYFYEAIGKPTGEVARNLADFLEKVKSVRSESLLFHLQRNDFQNWVGKTIGDSKLARKLGEISSTDHEEARAHVCKTLENRLKELKEPSADIVVGQDTAVILSPR